MAGRPWSRPPARPTARAKLTPAGGSRIIERNRGAMVQRLARQSFKLQIRVRFPVALPSHAGRGVPASGPSLPLGISPAGSRFAHARPAAQVRFPVALPGHARRGVPASGPSPRCFGARDFAGGLPLRSRPFTVNPFRVNPPSGSSRTPSTRVLLTSPGVSRHTGGTYSPGAAWLGRSTMRRRGERGFSLLEMMAVVAILLILGAMASPSLMRAIRSYRLESSTRQIADILKRTRYEAMRRNQRIATAYQAPMGARGAELGIDFNMNGSLDTGEPRAQMPPYLLIYEWSYGHYGASWPDYTNTDRKS